MVLKKGDCLSSCGKGWYANGGVCRVKGFNNYLVADWMERRIVSWIKPRTPRRFRLCYRQN
jgi:hypothetical protein